MGAADDVGLRCAGCAGEASALDGRGLCRACAALDALPGHRVERYALPPLDERLRVAARALERYERRAGREVCVTPLQRPGAGLDDAPGAAERERGGAFGHEHDALADDARVAAPGGGQDDHGVEQ